MLRLSLLPAIALLICPTLIAGDVNSLAYLDECNPWYPDKDFPKLITPQWVGEEGVECVVVLAIDDMRDTAKYEQYLRPILNRLKQIDGRAPVSIMTCDVKPDDPQLQSWLEEGLSIDVHTVDHPCPILQGGDFDKAKSTYDRCIDLLNKIPGNKPVAFRTPCCDSLNTVSPRSYSEIFNKTTPDGHSLQIDSSVFNFFTSDDESIPKELVLDKDGKERFWKYLPRNNNYGGLKHDNFVNYIKNYPYPYVINNSCWQFPCVAPSDWSAQHLHGVNNPLTVEDWKAALDITVHKQGVFNLVFHPHGWITAEQVVELIDHAVEKHGKKVKFLTFREAAERLNKTFATHVVPELSPVVGWRQMRILDINNDGFMDFIDGGIGHDEHFPVKALESPASSQIWSGGTWRQQPFPLHFWNSHSHLPGAYARTVNFISDPTSGTVCVADLDPSQSMVEANERSLDRQPLVYTFEKGKWIRRKLGPFGPWDALHIPWQRGQSQWRDFDGDGIVDLLLFHKDLNSEWDDATGDYIGENIAEIWLYDQEDGDWQPQNWKVPISPSDCDLKSLRFVDINNDHRLDLIVANEKVNGIWLQSKNDDGWTNRLEVSDGSRLLPITRPMDADGYLGKYFWLSNNGFFIHDRHLCWQNEDTAHLPDLIHRVSFDDILAEAARDEARRTLPPVLVGAAVVDITPDYPVRLTGYGNRATESEGVGAKIHARALVIGGSSRSLTLQSRAFPPSATSPASASSASSAGKESPFVGAPSSAAERRQHVAPGASPGNDVPMLTEAPAGPAAMETCADPSGLGGVFETDYPGLRPGLHAAVPPGLNRNRRDTFRMSGSNHRHAPSTPSAIPVSFAPSIAATPLPAEAARPDSGESSYTVLITVDNCGVPATVTEAVYNKVAAKHNIPRERFAISSTHTHSGPWLRDFAPNVLTNLPPEHAAHLKQYEKDLIDNLAEVVDKAIAARKPGRLSIGRGKLGFAMNRRVLNNGTWQGFGETPDGPVDNHFPVLAAHDTDGKLIAVLANYACHATTETGAFNQISGDWPGFAADMIEAENPGAVALIAIGCGADANPSPRGTHEQAKQHGRAVADEVKRLLGKAEDGRPNADDDDSKAFLTPIAPNIVCNIARIDLPLGPLPSRETWEAQAKNDDHAGVLARKWLKMLDNGESIPTTVPDYPVQTWCFGDDLAMVFLGGEVVVDYSIRLNSMFDDQRLWINAYSNDVPCYIASKRILREGGYEADRSMVYYAHPTRLAPEAEDLICDAVQKLLPHAFYSDGLQATFPGPKSPEESLGCITIRPGLKAELVAAEPLIHDPVAFDWDVQGRMWVVEMGGYPSGAPTPERADAGQHGMARRNANSPGESNAAAHSSISTSRTVEPSHSLLVSTSSSGSSAVHDTPTADHSQLLDSGESSYGNGRIRVLTDVDNDGRYDEAVTFLDDLNFPTGIHPWRNGWIITAAPDIIYAEDTDGDFIADVRKVLFSGFTEGNQQHRVNGLRWGLDGWLYLANGDSGGMITAVARLGGEDSENAMPEQPINIRGRDIRIHPDTGAIETLSGQTQSGRNRDDFGNWFGNNNSNPIWHYVLEDRYLSRNPHATGAATKAQVAEVPGAAPVFPTSKTLARFNDFHTANRFTSACSTSIYRDNLLGGEFYGNAFTCEPVHNLVSRLVLERDGVTFKGRRAKDEQNSEFFTSSDNWTRPVMVRTGPDGAIYIADMYRQVIEHPEWIPAEYQRKLNLRAGEDRGRIYRVDASRSLTLQSRAVPVAGLLPPPKHVSVACCSTETEAVEETQLLDSESASSGKPVLPAAKRRKHVAPGGSPGPNMPDITRAPKGRQRHGTDDAEFSVAPLGLGRIMVTKSPGLRPGLLASVPSGANQQANLREWFEKPASAISTDQLIKRLASPNGWWRDTAQRLLAQRRAELPLETLMPQMSKDRSPAMRVQGMSALADASRTEEQKAQLSDLLVSCLDDDHPEVRRHAIRLQEQETGHNRTFPQLLPGVMDDQSPLVLQQLALAMGPQDADISAVVLAALLVNHGDNLHIVDAVYSSVNADNVESVLLSLSKSSKAPPPQVYGRVLRMAAAFEKGPSVVVALESILNSIAAGTAVSPDSWNAAADVLEQVHRSKELSDLVSQRESTLSAWNNVRQLAGRLSINTNEAERTRLAALNFLRAGNNIPADTRKSLIGLLSPETPPEIQQATIQTLSAANSDDLPTQLLARWRGLTPSVRGAAVEAMMTSTERTAALLNAVETGTLTTSDLDATYRERLLNHKDNVVRSKAVMLFGNSTPSARAELVDRLKFELSDLKSDAAAGKAVFEKRCATCHKIGDVGKQIGADLTALKDRSTDAMLTAILDPNRAVEAKFFSYSAVTTDGRTHNGMLLNETGNSVTLMSTDGKEHVVARADLEELVCSNRSLMPEGLEKDLNPQQLADVIAFVQSSGGTKWKSFEGNSPSLITANADGTITLPATAAEIYGPNLIFEGKYQNLGWWSSTNDYAVWTVDVPRGGHWTVEAEYACDNGSAGGLLKLSTGVRLLTARVPGTGTWDDYRTWTVGKLDLGGGRRQIIVTAPEKPPMALIDLKAIRLIPPE